MNTLVTLFFATLMLSPTTWAAINPDDILKGQTNCPQLATSTQSKETILEFARRGSKIEICSSTPQIAQEDLMSLSIQDRKNITLFVNNKTYDLNALQNLTHLV